MPRIGPLLSVAIGGASLAVLSGCTTIKSTEVKKDPSGCGWTTKKYHGMPITVKVPTSVKLTIKETRYYSKTGTHCLSTMMEWIKAADIDSFKNAPLVTREVVPEVIETAETFYVDIPRPAAGSLAYGATIDADSQYFTALNSDIDDKTVKDITAALGSIVDAIPKTPAKAKPTSASNLADTNANGTGAAPLLEIVSDVAVQVFDVKSPTLTQDMHAFVSGYITDCHVPCNVSTAPKVALQAPAGTPRTAVTPVSATASSTPNRR